MYRGITRKEIQMKKHAFPVKEWERAFLRSEEDITLFKGYCEALDISELNPIEFFNIAYELKLNIRRS